VDVARVNGRLFLNTSSVGAYVVFVRLREQLERRMGYRLASVLAALGTLGRLHRFTVEIEVDGVRRRYLTPIVFVGVGERELRLPALGDPVGGGRAGLHVFVVRGRTRAALFGLAVVAAAAGRGARAHHAAPRQLPRGPRADRDAASRVATSRWTASSCPAVVPLDYELARGELAVVTRGRAAERRG
jgi:hypothetical protein